MRTINVQNRTKLRFNNLKSEVELKRGESLTQDRLINDMIELYSDLGNAEELLEA